MIKPASTSEEDGLYTDVIPTFYFPIVNSLRRNLVPLFLCVLETAF